MNAAMEFGPLDADAERARLSAALVEAMGDLDEGEAMAGILARFADRLAAASSRLRLAWLYLGDPRAPVIRPQYCAGPEQRYGESLSVDRSALMMRGPVRRALEEGQAVVQDIPPRLGPVARLLPGVTRWHRAAVNAGVFAVLALPFPLLHRSEWGLVTVYADHPAYFARVGLEPFLALARLVQVGLDRIALRESEQRNRADLERLRARDAATGLLNRAGLQERLGALLGEGGERIGLVQLDLDDFSELNADLGPGAGDEVLLEVAGRLRQLAPDAEVARLGADEFVVLFRNLPAALPAGHLAERCQAALARPLQVAGRGVSLSAAAGVTAVVTGDAAEDALTVLRHAGVALAGARRLGRGEHCLYGPHLESRVSSRHVLYAELRQGLRRGELQPWFQPQLALRGPQAGQVVGFEALLRWQHPRQGQVAPGRFMPEAEASPLIRDIGLQVLDATLTRLAAPDCAALTAGVNIGARHLLDERFIEDVTAALSRHPGVPPERLEIEVTETAAFADVGLAVRVLQRLRALGCRVALDDFGTGQASLTHLQDLPVTRLKIDRRFVSRLAASPREFAIVAGTLVTARGLGIETVAEGVEAAEEQALLTRLGCDVLQGFLLARPMPGEALGQWLASHRPDPALPAAPPQPGAVLPLLELDVRRAALRERLEALGGERPGGDGDGLAETVAALRADVRGASEGLEPGTGARLQGAAEAFTRATRGVLRAAAGGERRALAGALDELTAADGEWRRAAEAAYASLSCRSGRSSGRSSSASSASGGPGRA
ncbi:putative bifunctional diguanylate cyclase/phosphodiesterase [Spiribacter halobius]|nr:bifunctional diguanylate cyclase/phosphodiesterase [Spiribacter halobius]UEX78539.1 bifunctional diguanylate cyclase/phosphodiesterase [Spiribacter halobius]